MRYSSRERRWYGKRDNRPAPIDGYSPDSPDYAERNRERGTSLPNGLTRIDLGAPADPRP